MARWLGRWTFAVVLMLVGVPASGQIKIGQTAGFTGPVAAGVKETAVGAMLFLDAVNARGGVNGQRIEISSLDDRFDPKLAAENARSLIAQGVVALFLTRGTPHAEAIAPLLAEHKVALIAPSTGAMVLHQPVNPWIFNVRATYQREAERTVQHLNLIGIERIAIVQVDDSFGADAVIGALKGFTGANKRPLVHEKYDRVKPDFKPIATKIAAANAQVVLFIGSGSAVVDGIAEIRAAGSRAQLATLSNNASSGFVKSLKEHARGTIIAQVFPSERSMSAPIVREAYDLAKAKGIDGVTPAMLEGFTAAKVLVEGLKRAGPNPTRVGLQKALETFKKVDLGGLEISYSPASHTGLDFADLSIVGADGKMRR
jgi:ABC-type branched-subunit amino acid transport system substrate-binding protein